MGDTTYASWKARLEGAKVPTHDGDPDVGFYRKPIRTKREEGNKITGWVPVAYFMDGKKLIGVIGDRDMTANEITDLWTYVCAYPIPEEVYRDVDAGKPWPAGLIGEPKQASRTAYPDKLASDLKTLAEMPVADIIPAAGRTVTVADNAPPITADLPLDQQHRQAIENATKEPVPEVTCEEDVAIVTGRKNRVAELRLAADKAGKSIYEPMYRAYTTEQKKWSPLAAICTTFEKKCAAAVLTFRENERKRLLALQEEADRKQREIDEANQRAADRAIIRGDNIDPGEEAYRLIGTAAHNPAFEETKPAPVAPTYGTRTVKEELKKFAEIHTPEAWAQVREHFKDNAEVRALLMKLAQAEVNAGRTVLGVTIREGLI